MAAPRALTSLGKALLVSVVVVPPAAVWLSGRFGEDADREPRPAASAWSRTVKDGSRPSARP